MRTRHVLLLVPLLLTLLFAPATPAAAHAALRSTTPTDGTVLDTAPRDLTLTFTEPVALLDGSIRLLDPGNHRVELPEPTHGPEGDRTVRVALPEGLGRGTFTVAWRVVSADSHPVSGAFTFSVGEPTPTTAAPDLAQPEHPATAALHNAARYLAYLAAALLLGTAVFTAVCRPADPGRLRPLLRTGWWALLAATVALLMLRAPYEAGTAPWTGLDADALNRTLTGRPGRALLARLVLLAAAALYLRKLSARRTPATHAVGVVLATGLALTWAAAEHASAGIQVPAAMTSSVLHLLAMAVWLGGLAALLRGTPSAETTTRFSRLALTCVGVLVVTGVYQSWRGLGSLDAFTGTAYGRVLLTKLGVVAVLLTAAAFSRRWTTRLERTTTTTTTTTAAATAAPVATAATTKAAKATVAATAECEAAVRARTPQPVGGPATPVPDGPDRDGLTPDGPAPESSTSKPPATEPRTTEPPTPDPAALRRSVLAEATLAVLVLVVTTVLTSTLPGRAVAEAAAPARQEQVTSTATVPFDVGTPGGRGRVQVSLDPARAGANSVQAVVFGPDGGFATVPELRISFTLPAQDLGPIDARLTDRGGYWATDDVTLPLAGTWTMKVTVRVSEVDQVTESTKVRIGA
ncbi:copper resistance protein CopC [Streptomyces sp. NPDC005017]|uniref:copper resistance CopC/CopD family protein n=1 Tax=Streptomyces sp. NPDC005017 TaxID=3364706 RepID=UPI0036A94914